MQEKVNTGRIDIEKVRGETNKRMSSKARWFTWKWKGNNYDIGLSAPSSGGRGTRQTKDQELSWMLVLSGMQYGGDPSNKEEFISLLTSNSSVYGKIEGVDQSMALGLASFLDLKLEQISY